MQASCDKVAKSRRHTAKLHIIANAHDPLGGGRNSRTNAACWALPSNYGLIVMVAADHPSHPAS